MTKKQIINRTKYWQNKLGLNNWKVNVWFEDYKASVIDDKYIAIAKTDCNPVYLTSDIFFRKSCLHRANDSVIIHELTHLILSDVISYVFSNYKGKKEDDLWLKYFEEKTVTIIERVITRLN